MSPDAAATQKAARGERQCRAPEEAARTTPPTVQPDEALKRMGQDSP